MKPRTTKAKRVKAWAEKSFDKRKTLDRKIVTSTVEQLIRDLTTDKHRPGDIQRILETEDLLAREYRHLAADMKKVRKSAKLSVREFGELIGCTGMNVSLIERRKARPTKQMMSRYVVERMRLGFYA